MGTIPKLAMIPSGYGTGKLHSVLPTDGSGDFTFIRSGEAKRTNSQELIETMASGVPRLDYLENNDCQILILESASENLM